MIQHLRTLHDNMERPSNDDVEIISVITETGLENRYSDNMAQFAPFASEAAHNRKVFGILQDSLIRLKGTQVTSNEGMPPTTSM